MLTATASGAFADKNAGTNKAVTVQNASLSGTDAANYVLSLDHRRHQCHHYPARTGIGLCGSRQDL